MDPGTNLTSILNITSNNGSDIRYTTNRNGAAPVWYESGRVQIPLYAVIFMLAVVGNTLVILTLVSITSSP